jgi:hypothetical protein
MISHTFQSSSKEMFGQARQALNCHAAASTRNNGHWPNLDCTGNAAPVAIITRDCFDSERVHFITRISPHLPTDGKYGPPSNEDGANQEPRRVERLEKMFKIVSRRERFPLANTSKVK